MKGFSKKYVQMANKHVERSSTSLSIREMQVKIIMQYYFIYTRWLISKTGNKCWLGDNREPSYVAAGIVKWYSHLESCLFIRMLSRVIIWPNSITRRYSYFIVKRNENVCLYKNLYINVHGSTIHNTKLM